LIESTDYSVLIINYDSVPIEWLGAAGVHRALVGLIRIDARAIIKYTQ